jgi:hypothetical protein
MVAKLSLVGGTSLLASLGNQKSKFIQAKFMILRL